jgi:hypothetical protein
MRPFLWITVVVQFDNVRWGNRHKKRGCLKSPGQPLFYSVRGWKYFRFNDVQPPLFYFDITSCKIIKKLIDRILILGSWLNSDRYIACSNIIRSTGIGICTKRSSTSPATNTK